MNLDANDILHNLLASKHNMFAVKKLGNTDHSSLDIETLTCFYVQSTSIVSTDGFLLAF